MTEGLPHRVREPPLPAASPPASGGRNENSCSTACTMLAEDDCGRAYASLSFWIADNVPSPRSSADPTGQLTLADVIVAEDTSVKNNHE